MVDTGRAYGQSVYGVPSAHSLSNQFASMPSLHVGWALLLAIVMVSSLPGRFRWLWALHPVVTLVVVVVTANHYWLDAAAGGGLVLVALAVSRPAVIAHNPCARVILSRTPCAGRG